MFQAVHEKRQLAVAMLAVLLADFDGFQEAQGSCRRWGCWREVAVELAEFAGQQQAAMVQVLVVALFWLACSVAARALDRLAGALFRLACTPDR